MKLTRRDEIATIAVAIAGLLSLLFLLAMGTRCIAEAAGRLIWG